MPTCSAIAAAVAALSPVSIHTCRPRPCSWATASRGLRLDGVGDGEHARPAAPSTATNIGVRPAAAAVGGGAGQRGDVHAAGGHQRRVADQHRPAVDDGVDAVAGHRLEGGQAAAASQGAGGRGGDDGLADRVLAARLGGGDQRQHVVLGPARERGDRGERRPAAR